LRLSASGVLYLLKTLQKNPSQPARLKDQKTGNACFVANPHTLFHQSEGLKQLFVYLLQAYSLRRCFAAGVKRWLQPSHEVFEAFSL
jgi:hypothetical protein